MLGPIDYIAVSFKGNNFDGSILEALAEAVESGVIRVVDILLIVKDKEGAVALAEIEDQTDDLKQVSKSLGHTGALPLLTEDDARKLAQKMPNDTSAGVLVIEQLWAKNLKQALLNKGAELVAEGRIHPDKAVVAYDEVKNLK